MTSSTDAVVDLRSLWEDREADAEAMIPLIGRPARSQGVVTTIYGRSLLHASVRDLLKLHRYARHIDGAELPTGEDLTVLQALTRLDLAPTTIDIAELRP